MTASTAQQHTVILMVVFVGFGGAGLEQQNQACQGYHAGEYHRPAIPAHIARALVEFEDGANQEGQDTNDTDDAKSCTTDTATHTQDQKERSTNTRDTTKKEAGHAGVGKVSESPDAPSR